MQDMRTKNSCILVFGAGVIGSVYAAWLHAAGQQVTLLARGRRLRELRTHGLQVAEASTGHQMTIQIPLAEHLAPTDAYDLVIVAVRLEQVDDVLAALAANHQTPTVLFLLNNASGPERFVQALGAERVVRGFPGIGGEHAGPIIRYEVIRQQPTTLGEVDGRITPRLQQVAALFRAEGHPVAISQRMDAWLKTHAVFVTSITAAITRMGGDSVKLAGSRAEVVTMVRAIREGFRALQALGVPITPTNLKVLFLRIPAWFAVRYWQRALKSPVGMLAIAPHARAAHEEMAALAAQVQSMLRSAPMPTPTLNQLLASLG